MSVNNNTSARFIAPQTQILGGNPTLTSRLTGYVRNISWPMLLGGIFVVIILGLFAYMTYSQMKSSGTAFHANNENIPINTNSNKTAKLMLFYVDWCPHCKTAKPEWENMKAEYDGKNINGYTIVFEEHNCTTESEYIEKLMDQYQIEGYPTIKLIKDNQVIEYDAKPTKSTMEKFLTTVL